MKNVNLNIHSIDASGHNQMDRTHRLNDYESDKIFGDCFHAKSRNENT